MRSLDKTLTHILAGLPLFLSLMAQAEVAPGCKVDIDENEPSSIRQHQLQASAGDACSQFNMGYFHYTHQQYEQAQEWYAKAADQGIPRAAFEIAMFYRDDLLPGGEEPQQRWLTQAAEQGLGMAQVELGIIYLEGRETEEELLSVMHWFEQAAKQGNAQGQYLLGEQYWSDQRGIVDMGSDSGDERAERYAASDAKALYWLCQAAQKDNEFAQFSLSEAYSRGRGVAVDQLQSRIWLEQAAANGDPDAIANLEGSSPSWSDQAELWLRRQAGDAQPRCPEVALALQQ